MTLLTVVIAIHNGLSYTKRTIANLMDAIAVANDSAFRCSILVIDDGSTDGSGEWIRNGYPEVQVLTASGSLWWSASMNLGARFAIEQAHSEYVVCWNNDILCAADYFVNLKLILLNNPGCSALLGSKIYFLDSPNTICSVGGKYFPRSDRATMIGHNEADSDRYAAPVEADWTGGMGTVIHRTVFDNIGYWDATMFPQTYGDCDFCLRARCAGFRLSVRPELRVWNDKSSSGIDHKGRFGSFLLSFVHLNSNYNIRAKWRFCRRHSTSWLAFGYLILFFLRYTLRFSRTVVRATGGRMMGPRGGVTT